MKKKGIALLLTVILVSITLAISIGISNIIATEISLSNTGRQSQLALYAADAALDCAIYWDTLHPNPPLSNNVSAFATSTNGSNSINNACSGDLINVGGKNSCVSGLIGDEPFSACSGADDKKAGRSTLTLTFDNGSCAKVTIYKRENVSNPSDRFIETQIHSDGHSTGDSNCSSNNPRVFQRSLEVTTYE